MRPNRPLFIVPSADVTERTHRYPNSDEDMAPARAIGRAAGLLRIGVHLLRVPPGRRTSYPHAESTEEEFVYVIEGEIDAWIDGELHRMKAGDFAAFPSGTGICHTFINDGERDALLLSGGEADKSNNRIYPAARAIRNNPAPTTMAPVARATRSPAGARRSTVMAAATTAIARRSMTPMTRRIAIRPAQQWLQWRPRRRPCRQAAPASAGSVRPRPGASRQQAR